MLTWANYYYLDFATSWLAHIRRLNITCHMIGTMDNELLQASPAPCYMQQLDWDREILAALVLRVALLIQFQQASCQVSCAWHGILMDKQPLSDMPKPL